MVKQFTRYLETHRAISASLAILWTIILLVACSMPGNELPKVDLFDHADKIIHWLFFVLFFIAWKITFYQTNRSSRWILIISVILGFSIEYYQLYFVKGRSFDVWDGIFDAIGAWCGFLYYRYYLKVE